MESTYILEMLNVSKTFGKNKVLDDISLKVRRGTVHALVGENGAGKSTMMKILLGLYTSDTGKIMMDGRELSHHSAQDALKAGIAMVHQELSSILDMTVTDNIFLGKEKLRCGLVAQEEQNEEVKNLLQTLKIDVSPKEKLRNLSTAYAQLVEIAKAISYNAKLIIMDEPTSSLSEKEAENLLNTIKMLRDKGTSIIYISHKLDEIFKIADDVTVLCDGKCIVTDAVTNFTPGRLIQNMVGRELKQMYPAHEGKTGEELLRVEGFSKKGMYQDITFSAYAGEILGIAGLIGAGRTELLSSVFGIMKPDAGKVYIRGRRANIRQPKDAIRQGIGMVTEDRRLTGIFAPLSVADNMAMPNYGFYMKGIFVNESGAVKDCDKQKKSLKIKASSLKARITNLSGGNQQKVLLSRWLMRSDIDILIVDEPTRGIDVMAKYEISSLLCEFVNQGKTVIMISSELPEVIGMSDRVMVMHEGRMTGFLSREELTQENVMQLATKFSDKTSENPDSDINKRGN